MKKSSSLKVALETGGFAGLRQLNPLGKLESQEAAYRERHEDSFVPTILLPDSATVAGFRSASALSFPPPPACEIHPV